MTPLTCRRQCGFSLIELLIVMAIVSLALGSIYAVFASAAKSNTDNEVTAEVMNHLRTSLGYMEADIRMAGLDRFGTADAGIEAASAIAIRFTADRNLDGAINAADLSDGIQEGDLERITYAYDSATKRLWQCLSEGTPNESWDTVANHVADLQLRYFDENGMLLSFPIADLARIRSVEISLTIAQPSGFNRRVVRTATKSVFIRNLSM
ncbi:MAG: prepilin-type N-terminal cleavage/methylation domain-containing protein [Desulfobacterales bacterium]|jgi:prepilin-type N-terminal cleavage/methylation domain-containing protein|nr:prepilin-type N-terminal cleavage/methylation domain-containing protein [Desulfobacterales bacterium]